MYYIYVLDPSGIPLMPTTRYGKVRRMLKTGQAVAVRTKPFTIRLTYEPATRVTQVVTLGIDPGRTNIGLAAVDTAGRCLYSAKCKTRNKQIPKLMADRAVHRRASRRGERLARKRLAKKLGTTRTFLNGRILPGCDKPILLKDIINTESRFNNRHRPEGWLTPTATQLLRTHLNLVKKVRQLLPVTRIAVELNRFAFMAMDNPSIKRWQYQKGPLYGYSNIQEALKELQCGACLLCGTRSIEHDHHIVPYLMKELEMQFPSQVYATAGLSTKAYRDNHNITKDHNTDAYCIACSTLGSQTVLDVPYDNFHIRQFRRHDRQRIKSQAERTYQLDGKVVAKNRRKRMDQKEPSLHEWFLEMKKQHGQQIARQMQSRLNVVKSARRYNNLDRLLPGATFLYAGSRYTMTGQLSGGMYLRACGTGKQNYPVSRVNVLFKNTGLVYVT